jgi:CHASE2 domain-containing sensor protein/tRNA A-37 threonylcarbamoyl transferase component Bud32
MLGTLLNGRYRIVRVLGSGGFGQAYVAEDTQHPARVFCVVKQFKPARQDSNFLEIARRLFFGEAATLRKLGSHDQIPALIDDFEENREFYLVQEYIEGQTLSDELAAQGRLSEPEVITLLQDLLEVLEFVHQNHVIHRDIKPSNLIRRQRDRKFVLIDFGAVKEIQTQLTVPDLATNATVPHPSGATNYTVAIGTHGYGPSEQLMGKPRYNSDLYALGMTAIQALTGLQPSQLPTHPETAEVVWRDEANVSPQLADILDRMVRYHFNQRFQSAQEVLRALSQPFEAQTAADPTEPGAIGLDTRPVTGGTTPLKPLPERRRTRVARASAAVGIASVAVSTLVVGMRQLGWLQAPEVAVYDRMMQVRPEAETDPRLLVVEITDADIQQQKRFPLADRTIAQALKALKSYEPRVIGLDLVRDIPQEPGRAELLAELKAPNVIAIRYLGNSTSPGVAAPPGVPPDRVGFNDIVLDDDSVIRRNLMFGEDGSTTVYSFSFRLALAYLARETGITSSRLDADAIQLGKSIFHPLESHSGGYQAVDAQGYQVLLNYRGKTVARQISLTEVLNGSLQPEWVKDKVVLIGTTAATAKDLFLTPFSSAEKDAPKMAGVLIHAHSVSQILTAVLEGNSLFWFWSEWVEGAWIVGWAILGGGIAWCIRRPIALGISGTGLLIVLSGIGFALFLQRGWIPIVAPGLAAAFTGSTIVAYRAYAK